MDNETDTTGNGTDIVYKTDKADQGETEHEPGVLVMVGQKVDQRAQIKNNTAAAKGNAMMGAALVGLIDNIVTVGDPEVENFHRP